MSFLNSSDSSYPGRQALFEVFTDEEWHDFILDAHENFKPKHNFQSPYWEDQNLVPKIHQVEVKPDTLHFDLPGHGQALPTCGLPITLAHDAGSEWHFRTVKHNCHRFECPYCNYDHDKEGEIRVNSQGNPVMSGWLLRATQKANDRMEAYFKFTNMIASGVYVDLKGLPETNKKLIPLIQSRRRGFRRKPVHLIFSPPQDINFKTKGDFKRLKAHLFKVATSQGIDAGWWAFHPYRIPTRFNTREMCVEGPHFHVIADGYLKSNPGTQGKGYNNSGWVIKNKGIRQSLFATIGYILSHAGRGILPSASSSSKNQLKVSGYFGLAAVKKFRFAAEQTGDEVLLCKVCKQEIPKKDWLEVAWGDRGPPGNMDHGIIFHESAQVKHSIISGNLKADRLEMVSR